MSSENPQKILAVIPARGGSKGIKKKNLTDLKGKPLIAYTIEVALRSRWLTHVIVSTDSMEIKEIAVKWKAEVPFIRPEDLATDLAEAIPTIQHAVSEMEKRNGYKYNYVVMLQPTSPLRTADDIDLALEKLITSGCDSVISVVDVGGCLPPRMKFLSDDRLIDPPFCEAYENQPRQELEPMYIRDGAIYSCKRDVLMEQNSFKGKNCRAYIMPRERAVNIDTYFDLKLAEFLMTKIDD